MEKQCQICGVKYIRIKGTLSDKQWEERKFCSHSCSRVHHSNIMKGRVSKLRGRKMVKNIKYAGLHVRIRKQLVEPNTCPTCNRVTKLDLCNISQNYLDDINDWEYLCRRCHMTKDGRIHKLVKNLTNYKL